MPGSYLIDVTRGIVFTRAWGAVTDGEILAHAAALRADTRFDSGLRQIADFRELTELRVTHAGVSSLARANPYDRRARRAFVVPSGEAFGVVRMFGLYADTDDEQFRIFHEIGPAMEWIGLEPGEPWPSQPPDATFEGP